MHTTLFHDNVICTDNGHKPPNLHQWGGIRDIYALHYVVRGKGFFKTGGTTYPLKTSESFIIFPHTEVYYYPDSEDPWEYVWVNFKGPEALPLLSLSQLSPQKPVVPASPVDLKHLFDQVEAAGLASFQRERSQAYLRLLLSHYMEYFPRDTQLQTNDYVRSAKKFMENNHYKAALCVADIVSFVNIERSYLFRLFKEATGMSLFSYLTAVRIRRACVLLQASKLPIKAVALSVGYQDQLYFSKVFKKAASCSPSEYRRRMALLTDTSDPG